MIASSRMYSLTINDLQTLSGMKANTIRLWESRHNLLRPASRQQKSRQYSEEDVERLLHLSVLYKCGWKTTELATLSQAEIKTEVDRENGSANSPHLQVLLLAALDLNEHAFNQALNKSIAQLGFENAITDVCHSYLACLALLTQPNHSLSAKEHFSVYLLQSRILMETDQFTSVQPSPQLALYSPVKAVSEIHLLYLNYLLRKVGWNVLYLGNGKRLNQVSDAVKFEGLKYLWAHLGGEALPIVIDDYINSLKQTFPVLTLIVSGNEVQHIQRRFINTLLLKSDAEIEAFISSYAFGIT